MEINEIFAFIFLAAFFTAMLSAVVGMAGGVSLLSVLSFWLPYHQLIPLHGAVQLISNGYRSFLLLGYIRKDFFISYALGAPLGAYLAWKVIVRVKPEIFWVMMAVLIFYTIFRPKKLPGLRPGKKGFFIVGILGVFLGMLVGASGPFLASFFVREDLKRQEIVATKSSMQLIGHLWKIPLFYNLGFNYSSWWPHLVLLGVATIAGTRFGIFMLHRISDKFFIYLFKAFLFFAALRLLWKVFV